MQIISVVPNNFLDFLGGQTSVLREVIKYFLENPVHYTAAGTVSKN